MLFFQIAGPDVSVPNNSLLSLSSQDKVPSLMDCSTVIPEGAGKPMGKHIMQPHCPLNCMDWVKEFLKISDKTPVEQI